MTPEVSHAPMSSLKDSAAVLHLLSQSRAQNKYDMSVTPPVSHAEMWPMPPRRRRCPQATRRGPCIC